MLIGHGWDLHQHSENKTLKLGGVNFDEQGFEGHSDGDILLHALCDALLGATGKKTWVIIFHLMNLRQKIFQVQIFCQRF